MMIDKLSKAKRMYQQQGVAGLKQSTIRFIFSIISPKEKIGLYNTVAVRDVPLFYPKDIFDNYEAELIAGIRSKVTEGDTVVIVGGGKGPSSVVAAREAGTNGEVITYEGAQISVKKIEDTLKLNDMDNVDLRHTIVGADIHLFGNANGANSISGSELPECDILVLDCEGAELDILRQYVGSPQSVIVETHTHFDSPLSEVRKQLRRNGYSVNHVGSVTKDIDVVFATTS